MSIGDKIYLPDKRTLDLVKNKVENIFAVVPTTVVVPEPSPLNKNYIADKGTLDDVKSELDALPIFTPDGTAIETDVLVGKTFLNNSITKKTGTMVNRGTISTSLTTQNGQYTIPSGYHSGTGKVVASFANLTASNIKQGVNIGGIVGTATTVKTKTFTNTLKRYSDQSSEGYAQVRLSSFSELGVATVRPDLVTLFVNYGVGTDGSTIPSGSIRFKVSWNDNTYSEYSDMFEILAFASNKNIKDLNVTIVAK